MRDNRIQEERLAPCGIPCLLVQPQGSGSETPLILHYHGWHSSKEDQRFLATLLARQGYRVVLPDADKHGERNPIDYDAPGALADNFWPIIISGADEARDLVAALQRDIGAVPERTVVSGVSMGGFIASAVFAEQSQLAGLININGALAWEHAEQVFRGEDGRGLADDATMSAIAARDPLKRCASFCPRPILMLHGTADQVISVAIERHAVSRVRPCYSAAPNRLELWEDQRSNHSVTLRMLERAFAWLGEYLPAESD